MSEHSTSTPYVADGASEIIPETRAKQGRRGYHVLAVLVASLVLVLAAFGVIFAVHAHTPSDSTPAAVQSNTRGIVSGSTT